MKKTKKNLSQSKSTNKATEVKRKSNWIAKISVFFISFVLASAIVVLEKNENALEGHYHVGEPASRSLFAPFEMTFEDEAATANLKLRKSSEVLPVYTAKKDAFELSSEKIATFFGKINEEKVRQELNGDAFQYEGMPISISESSLRYLYKDANLDEVKATLELLLEQTYKEGLISHETRMSLLDSQVSAITIFSEISGKESTATASRLRMDYEASSFALSILPSVVAQNRPIKKTIMEIYDAVIVPNLVKDEVRTAQKRDKAAAEIKPIQTTIKKDELLVQRGRLVTAAEKKHIDQIQQKLKKNERLDKLSGISLFIGLVYLLAFFYLYYFERKTLNSYRMLLLVHSVLLSSALICKLIYVWPGSSPYLMPTALAPLLLTLLAPARLGILSTFVMTVFAALITGFKPDIMLATLSAGMAATFSARRLHKRTEFLKIGAAISGSYFIALFAFQIYLEYGAIESFQLSALGFANGLLITIPICFLALPLLEYVFNVVTDVTLLELSDLNHPLLKRMVVEAPGTYHHSLVVSTLAESACEKIGANALLARVGCYFHDIGKIAKAEFFTENQRPEVPNKHEQISPSMSSFVIMDHVKGGVELGKKHKLKQRILDFIPEHHGTQVIYYFYRKALDQAKPGEEVTPDDFRYSGPKPQSRETAVALLADSTEAASRSLPNPSPEAIQELVRKIINDKFIDGQLGECDLTLKDLHQIQESFVHNLMAIYHTRVSYPKKPDAPGKPDLFKDIAHVADHFEC